MHSYLFLSWINTIWQLTGELVDQIVGRKRRISFLAVLLQLSNIKFQF